MSGFSNPLVGGGGALVYPSIHSPDFEAGAQGWSVNKDGSSEFNDLTARGTLEAGYFIGFGEGREILIYSGAPALGNLVASVSTSAGTDSYGNAYLDGVASYGNPGANTGYVTDEGGFGVTDEGGGAVQDESAGGTATADVLDEGGFGVEDEGGGFVEDESGSVAPAGTTQGTAQLVSNATSGEPFLILSPPGPSYLTAPPQVYSGAERPGQSDEYLVLAVNSGQEGTGGSSVIQLFSRTYDGTSAGHVDLVPGGTLAMSATPSTVQVYVPVTADSWHDMSLENGWTVTPTGFAQYRLMPDGTVMVRFAGIAPGTIVDGTPLWTAPAGYVTTFAGTMSFPLAVSYVTAPSYPTSTPEVVIKGSEMQCFNLRGTVRSLACTFSYPLD